MRTERVGERWDGVRHSAATTICALLATTITLTCATPAHADTAGRSFEIYGFAQVDWIQDTKRTDPNWEDAFRPSKIATPEGQFGTNGQASVSVKQSRFGVKGTVPTGDNSPPIDFKFEFDMFGTGVDAGQTTFRLRHAYGEWGQILVGKTHSLFMDIDVFPDVIDYWGPSGMVFNRDPQIRWTPYRTSNAQFAISIEQPSNDADPGNIRLIEEYANATVRGNETVPDLAAHYWMGGDWGHFQVAGLLRRVGYEYQVAPGEPFFKGSKTGWGINLSSVINMSSLVSMLEKDRLLLQLVHGDGIATYMNDGGMDLAPTATLNPLSPTPNLDAEAVPLTGLVAYYGHYWTPKLESSVGYSYTEVTNTNFQATNAFHKGDYASGNLIFYPTDKVMFGVEAMWGRRTDNNGVTGYDWRFQLSGKYNFGIKL
jgi:hypothetical protein